MKVPITFLGTSQAIPTAKRNHSAFFLQYGSENILIDCGEGTQRQFRKAHLNPCKLTRLVLTHWHGDHVLGIAGLFQTLLLNGYKKTLYIYGPRGTKDKIKKLLDLFVPYNTIPLVIKEVSSGKFLETSDFYLEASPMKHGIPCNAYAFVIKSKTRLKKDKLKKLGLLNSPLAGKLQAGKSVKHKGKTISPSTLSYKTPEKKITFILDTELNPNCHKISKGAETIITEAVYLNHEADLAKLHQHLTAEQAGMIAARAGASHLYLAHLSQRYDGSEDKVLKEAKKKFKNSIISEDLMRIEA